jgi:hypothetical protein
LTYLHLQFIKHLLSVYIPVQDKMILVLKISWKNQKFKAITWLSMWGTLKAVFKKWLQPWSQETQVSILCELGFIISLQLSLLICKMKVLSSLAELWGPSLSNSLLFYRIKGKC